MHQVIIKRLEEVEKYLLYPSGLLIPSDSSTDALPGLRPGAKMFNRMVEVNNRVRPLLGVRAAEVGEVDPVL